MAKSAAGLEATMATDERELSHRYVKVLSSDFSMAKVFEETVAVDDVKELKEDQLKMIIQFIKRLNAVIAVNGEILVELNKGPSSSRNMSMGLGYLKYHMVTSWLQVEKFICFHCCDFKLTKGLSEGEVKTGVITEIKEDDLKIHPFLNRQVGFWPRGLQQQDVGRLRQGRQAAQLGAQPGSPWRPAEGDQGVHPHPCSSQRAQRQITRA